MLFGSSDIQVVNAIPHSNMWRQHLYQIVNGKIVWPSVNGPIPTKWPAAPTTTPGVLGFYTIYPNPDQLLAGRIDTQIKAMIKDAPPQSMLTAYAEADANPGSGGQFAPLGLTRDKLLKVHAKVYSLCAGSNVRYGAVNCGYGTANASFVVPGLDFYGLDIYEPCDPGVMNALNQWRVTISNVQPRPTLCIAECNSSTPSRRPFWFSAIFGWLKCYEKGYGKVAAMMTYWNPGGPLSGPWLPSDTATIDALKSIAWATP